MRWFLGSGLTLVQCVAEVALIGGWGVVDTSYIADYQLGSLFLLVLPSINLGVGSLIQCTTGYSWVRGD